MRVIKLMILATCLSIFASQAAVAEKRIVLIVGNSAYQNVPNLPNPSNDAAAMAALFRQAGFGIVNVHRNVGISDLRRAVAEFAYEARDADVAVIYFAGHGIEVDGSNYVIPIDARISRDFDIEDETVSLDRLLKAIEPAKRLRLVILDACRDNPFLKSMKRSVVSRSISRGLAKVEPTASDTLIAFAAKAGSVALDGDAKNSPFTSALLQNIAAPGLDLRIAFGRVRDDVLKATNRKQEPFVYGSLGGTVISLVDAPKQKQPQETIAIPADEIVWGAIQSSTAPTMFDEFAHKFPASKHQAAAKARSDQLKAQIESDAKQRKAIEAATPTSDTIVWSAIKDANDPGIFKEFASKFPGSRHVAEATIRLDQINRRNAEVAASLPSPPPATDEIVWTAIKDATSAAVFEEYIKKFPNSARKAEAQSKFSDLDNKRIAAIVPPPQVASNENPRKAVADLGLKVLSGVAETALKEGNTFKECERCPEMIVVPTGAFLMGSPDNEPQREALEGPQHRVIFAKAFAVARYAVTFDEWDTCVSDGGCGNYRPWDNGWGRGNRPVVGVSWQDARNYVGWLSEKTGKKYRFVSEAEREYVARAGTTSPFWWGANVSRANANFSERNDREKPAKASTTQKTMPVDAFKPNPWGFYQVSGNVWEWVEDCMNNSYSGAPVDGSAWISGNCERRVLRGGSWISESSLLRSAARYGVQAEGRVGNIGFRVARSLDR